MATLINDNGSTRTVTGLTPSRYDKVLVAYPDAVTTIFTYYCDGEVVGEVTNVVDGSARLISSERTA